MKRYEAVELLRNSILTHMNCEASCCNTDDEMYSNILRDMEKAGMRAPTLPEDMCQAILHIYYAGYSLNIWEEEFYKDSKAVAELERRQAYAALTPEQRVERIRKARREREQWREEMLKKWEEEAKNWKADKIVQENLGDEGEDA